MANIEYRLERPLWMLLLIPAAILLLVIFFTMKKETRRKGKTILSLILHGVIALILAVLAAGLTVATETDRQSTIILMDISDSTLSVREEMTVTCEALLSEFSDRDVKGVVLFGQDTLLIGKKSSFGRVSVEKADSTGTDLASALYEAVDRMDRYTHKRIILLSDGKETVGDALYAARRLGEEGVRMDTLYYDTDGQVQSEVQLAAMTSAGGSYVGDSIQLNLTLQSNITGEASVSIYEGDTLLETKTVTLQTGVQTLSFEAKAETAGMHGYRAVLSCGGDTETRNNEIFAILQTHGTPSILIIARNPVEAEPLKNTLSAEAEVTVVSQSEAPADLPTLCNYDGYYLMNTDASSLPAELGASLETAVRVFGKSLCFVGGDQTFGKGNMVDTAYSQMLPLKFGSLESSGRIMLLVIDNSGSMEGDYMELAKAGAIRIVESLGPADRVGVICFYDNLEAEIVVDLQTVNAENKEAITASISKIAAYTGTNYIPSLKAAHEMLRPFRDSPEPKHVIFLSDGMPTGSIQEIYKHTRILCDSGVTMTTIGMNEDEDKLFVLDNMAKLGDGVFHYVENAQDLPTVMLSQAEGVLPQYAFINPVTPQIAVNDPITAPLASADIRPQIEGYVGMHAKPEATVYLTAENGDPLYAAWEYGSGQVACFTTDLTGTWSGEFLNTEAGRSFVRNALKATYAEVRHDAAIIPTVTVDGGLVTVTAELPEEGNDFELLAEITGPEQKTIELERITDTAYEASTSLGTPGEYTVNVTWIRRNKTVDQTTALFTVSYSGEYDLFREGGASLLSEIAAVTGGLTNAAPGDLAVHDPGLLHSVITFELWLCLLAAVLMLADIAVRRLTLADIRKLFRRHDTNVK